MNTPEKTLRRERELATFRKFFVDISRIVATDDIHEPREKLRRVILTAQQELTRGVPVTWKDPSDPFDPFDPSDLYKENQR